MTKAELENKHLAELHALAAEAGVERYRMLTRAELIAKLSNGSGGDSGRGERSSSGTGSGQGERPARRRRSRGERKPAAREGGDEGARAREPRPGPEPAVAPEPAAAPEPPSAPAAATPESSSRPRRRRRRRFGRRGKQVTLQGLLLPPESGRQALLSAESREACTALLRGIAADLSDDKGPDPVALLIDPSPEELADWRRDAPKAEIVAAGQPRHASDALAQAVARAAGGDDVILLVDSLTRLGEAYDDPDAAKQFFDAGRSTGGTGTLTVVAALEHSS
jgi:transcription termination factor Rho